MLKLRTVITACLMGLSVSLVSCGTVRSGPGESEIRAARTDQPTEPPVESKRTEASAAPAKPVSLDAAAPWKIEFPGSKKRLPCPAKDGWLVPKVKLDAKSPKVLIRLDFGDVKALGTGPVKIEQFKVTIKCPEALAGDLNSPTGWAMFIQGGKKWKWAEPPGKFEGSNWANIDSEGLYSKTLPADFAPANDARALGIYVCLNEAVPEDYVFDGEFKVRIERLVVRPSK